MDPASQAGVQLTSQGFSLIFQQGIAFVVLSVCIIILILALIYVFRMYIKSVEQKDLLTEKYYTSSLEQTRVFALFTEKLNDVIRR